MSLALLLLPDFVLILFGFLLNRVTAWGRDFWSGLEKLIYFVLFPALLFSAISRTKIDFVAAGPALKTAVICVLAGMLLAWLAKPLLKPEPRLFASSFQTAFRFNSYIALAIAGRLHGDAGIAAIGIIIGVVVPLCNIASVWALAHGGKQALWRELLQNPLIIATVSGVLVSLSGWVLPDMVQMTLSRLGAASLACGLLCVGAALTLSNVGKNAPLISYMTAIKLVAMPALALILTRAFGVTGVFSDLVVLFAALPTATSAYVLAVRMGGDGRIVAQCITASTLGGMVAMPVWLTLARAW
jgi:malonate transporter